MVNLKGNKSIAFLEKAENLFDWTSSPRTVPRLFIESDSQEAHHVLEKRRRNL